MPKRKTLNEVNDLIKRLSLSRSHSFQIISYQTQTLSELEITCKLHNTTQKVSVKQYINSRYGVSCCSILDIRRTNTFIQRQQLCFSRVQDLANTRNHFITDFTFKHTKDCSFCVQCLRHNITFNTIKYHNYTNPHVNLGIPCCAYPVYIRNSEIPEKGKLQIKNRLHRTRQNVKKNFL